MRLPHFSEIFCRFPEPLEKAGDTICVARLKPDTGRVDSVAEQSLRNQRQDVLNQAAQDEVQLLDAVGVVHLVRRLKTNRT